MFALRRSQRGGGHEFEDSKELIRAQRSGGGR